MAVIGNDERVEIEVETVLQRGTGGLGYQAAGCGERRPIKAYPVPDLDQFVRRLPRILPASAADVDAKLFLERDQPALQRADDTRGDTGRMPVHAHNGTERLEPERESETAQQFVTALMM